ncbi:MAG: YibE/F family protein [Candidatus Merdivicinus sp.]|jgi:uncharacterized membrane protein
MNSTSPKSIWPVLERVAVLILSLLLLWIGLKTSRYTPTDAVQEECETATVLEVMDTYEEAATEGATPTTYVIFRAKMTSGEQKGEVLEMQQSIEPMILPKPDPVQPGDRILVLDAYQMGLTTDYQWIFGGQNRIPGMIWLTAAFLALVILIGRWKGVATVISLLITFAALFGLYIPSILMGRNIYWTTIVISLYVILSSLALLNGLNGKTLCAVIGNFGGIVVAGLLALIVNHALKITGMLDTEYTFLTMLSSDVSIDLRAVVWGGILIGSLGAIMDVSMSITSAMYELSFEVNRKNIKRMITAGMNIGRDAIGTMTNTLILAYIGGSLALVLLFTAYNRNPLMMLNFEMIVVEVVQAVVGSIGILFAVPITVLIAAWLFQKNMSEENAE